MTFIEKFTDDFVEEWNGRNLNVNGANINFDGRYGTQCMDLWNYWWLELELVGIPRHADAAGVWEDFGGKHYEYFDGILPDKPAKKGDIFIYNRQAWGTGYGHIGLVLADNGDSITVLETNGLGDGYEDEYMNQYGSPPRIHTWPKTNLYGYLRLIEDDMAVSEGFEKKFNELDRDLRAALELEKKTQDAFRRDVRATFDVVRATLEADKGLDKGELLEVIEKAVVRVEIGTRP